MGREGVKVRGVFDSKSKSSILLNGTRDVSQTIHAQHNKFKFPSVLLFEINNFDLEHCMSNSEVCSPPKQQLRLFDQ